jgi:anti-sigma factor RsiW
MAADDPPPSDSDAPSIHDDIQALLADHLDGSLPAAEAGRVTAHLAECEVCRGELEEARRVRAALSGLHKLGAPDAFRDHVTETIHRRSAGRFFARRTLGDRVPFGVLLIAALVVLLGIAATLWSSSTGSLRVDRPPEAAPVGDGTPLAPLP